MDELIKSFNCVQDIKNECQNNNFELKDKFPGPVFQKISLIQRKPQKKAKKIVCKAKSREKENNNKE